MHFSLIFILKSQVCVLQGGHGDVVVIIYLCANLVVTLGAVLGQLKPLDTVSVVATGVCLCLPLPA